LQSNNDNKSKEKKEKEKGTKVDFDKISKYLPPRPDDPNIVYDESMIKMMVERAFNEEQNERRRKKELKGQEEEHRRMEEFEKQQEERRKQKLEAVKNKPEAQFQMFVSGERYRCSGCNTYLYYEAMCRNRHCLVDRGIDIEPLMARLRDEITRLKQELSTGIIVDQQTFKMLNEFGMPDELYSDVIKRLVHIAKAAEATPQQQQQ
jgi:hypothetical protein